MKSKLLIISLLLSTLLISACTFKFSTVIEADGSGEFSIQITFTQADQAALEDELGDEGILDAEEFCDLMEQDFYYESDPFLDAIIESDDRGGDYICTFTIPFDDLDELTSIYDEMEIGEFNQLDMNSDGELEYDFDLDMTDADATDDLGLELNYVWELEVPGDPTDNNADDERGSTLTWDLRPGNIISIQAQSEPGRPAEDDRSSSDDSDGDKSSSDSDSSSGGFSFENSTLLWVSGIGLLCLCAMVILGGDAAFYFMQKNK